MENTKVITLKKVIANVNMQTLIFLGLASFAPLFPIQGVAGPMVNALLFIAVIFLGINHTLIVCSLPSVIALSTGLLPLALAPMIPFIIIGNMILVYSFNYFRENNYYLSVIIASVFKFLFIYSISLIIVHRFLPQKIVDSVSNMMSWPQLFNALLGGLIAFVFLKFIKKI